MLLPRRKVGKDAPVQLTNCNLKRLMVSMVSVPLHTTAEQRGQMVHLARQVGVHLGPILLVQLESLEAKDVLQVPSNGLQQLVQPAWWRY